MDPTLTNEPAQPSIDTRLLSAPAHGGDRTTEEDPLVKTWHNRIKAAKRHWDRFHRRVRHNRELVRGIDPLAEPNTPHYNKHRANLIQSTITVVLSKVYAKNPEMSAQPTNKSADLRLLCDTVSTVTQTMLEDAKLKRSAKRAVRAAMTCAFGIVKLQYQRDIRTDPIIAKRIQDSQDNVIRIEGLLRSIEGDEAQRADLEAKKRELEEAIKSLQASKEVVAGEGLVLDRVATDRFLPDCSIEDIWDYEDSEYLIEMIPMRKSKAMGLFPGVDLARAATFKVGQYDASQVTDPKPAMYSGGLAQATDDPMLMVYEVWNKADSNIYTLIEGINGQFARAPYQPEFASERWWPYFVLPFASVDGVFCAQSLVDVLEKLQVEHNETRDKFAEVRRKIRPHYIVSGDVSDKSIKTRLHPELGEMVVIDTGGGPLKENIQQAEQLRIDPAVFDTSPIQTDWETVSGLQDAARSIVVSPKTATEASISDQSLAARVAEFRDQVEDFLTEIGQAASELCLLAMSPQQVEQIMGAPEMPDEDEVAQAMLTGQPIVPDRTYAWPDTRTPDTVFSLVQMKVRAGSTAAPNKLQMQENWAKALPLLRELIMQIRAIDATGGDSTPERELAKETAARFDESIDIERFLPPLRPPALSQPTAMGAPVPSAAGAMPAGPMPGGIPGSPTLQ